MSTLNNMVSDTAVKTTTMPAWYDTAQQQAVTQAVQALSAAPQMSNTVAQNAINTLGSASNPYAQATSTLQSIASGAASPWITDASGNVTPNTSTALGGLFQAQNQQLEQLMPNIEATPNAAAIGSGQFGSLRGQTAANKAMGDAAAQLRTQQMQAALQNQQTGVTAAQDIGNVTSQQISDLLKTGAYQQSSPFTNVSNFSKILGSIQAPQTVSEQMDYSPLTMIGQLGTFLNSTTGQNILSKLGGGLSGLQGLLSGLGNSSSPTPADFGVTDTTPSPNDFGGFDISNLPSDETSDFGDGLWSDLSFD